MVESTSWTQWMCQHWVFPVLLSWERWLERGYGLGRFQLIKSEPLYLMMHQLLRRYKCQLTLSNLGESNRGLVLFNNLWQASNLLFSLVVQLFLEAHYLPVLLEGVRTHILLAVPILIIRVLSPIKWAWLRTLNRWRIIVIVVFELKGYHLFKYIVWEVIVVAAQVAAEVFGLSATLEGLNKVLTRPLWNGVEEDGRILILNPECGALSHKFELVS